MSNQKLPAEVNDSARPNDQHAVGFSVSLDDGHDTSLRAAIFWSVVLSVFLLVMTPFMARQASDIERAARKQGRPASKLEAIRGTLHPSADLVRNQTDARAPTDESVLPPGWCCFHECAH